MKTDNPSESTGQQQPEGEYPTPKTYQEALSLLKKCREDRDHNIKKQLNYRAVVDEISERFNGGSGDMISLYDAAKFTSEKTAQLQSLSRWREISKDGLPGESHHGKWIELLKTNSEDGFPRVKLIRWYSDTPITHNQAQQNFTHWRPIELPPNT